MTEAQSLFTPEEAATLLRFSRNTLAAWRSKGQGPAYLKMRGSVRYRKSLQAYLAGASDSLETRLLKFLLGHLFTRHYSAYIDHCLALLLCLSFELPELANARSEIWAGRERL